MCRFDRYTARRGAPAEPLRCLRTRACRRRRPRRFVAASMLLGSLGGLAGLLADELALVPHALALVRLGLADLPDVGGDLADHLLVVPPDRDPRGRGDLELDALGRLDVDRVGEAQRQLEVGALEHRAV